MNMQFVKAGDHLLHLDHIVHIDCTRMEELIASVTTESGDNYEVTGIPAIELVMQTRPSVLEGKRFRFIKNGFAIHNLIGHPLMQILAWFKCYTLAFKVHEITTPRPRGRKEKKNEIH